MSLIFYAGQRLNAAHLAALANEEIKQLSPGALNTTSATYVDITGASVSFTKIFAVTRVRFTLHLTHWVSAAIPTTADFAMRINAVDYPIALTYRNDTIGNHQAASGIAVVPGGLAAGAYTVQARWKRSAGTGTVQLDSNDRISFSVREIRE